MSAAMKSGPASAASAAPSTRKSAARRYLPAIIAGIGFALFLALIPAYRQKSLDMAIFQARSMLLVVPPIFILLGLLDVWVPRDKMIKYMGAGSGARGALLAFLLGSFAAGPLYGAFPFTAVLMRKGASLRNILIFIGAWSTTKLPLLLFESAAMGLRFTLARLAIDLVGIAAISAAIQKALSPEERKRLYEAAETLD